MTSASSVPTGRPPESSSADEVALAALPPDNVVERVLSEVVSDVAPAPGADSGASLRRINELETTINVRERRITEVESLLAQENEAEILREELESTRAHAIRLEEHVARLLTEREQLMTERGQLQAIAREVETLRASVDCAAAEAAELEEKFQGERAEKERLAMEVSLLRIARNS
jgi:hypothetical protein